MRQRKHTTRSFPFSVFTRIFGRTIVICASTRYSNTTYLAQDLGDDTRPNSKIAFSHIETQTWFNR
jgi:hypothetical protein